MQLRKLIAQKGLEKVSVLLGTSFATIDKLISGGPATNAAARRIAERLEELGFAE